jgi:DNA repair exonuclease SbcCD ATPase subunit
LSELSQKSFAVTPEMGKAIGEALARMNSAMRALDARNGAMASREQGQAMAALNRAAMQVQSALQAMMQGGGSGAGSLMQQLQKMAGQQMSINMQTQQMGGMSQQQISEAARLAKEQAAIQKSLEELNREAQQSGEQQKLLGDLQRIAEEMKEVVKNLEQNDINPETIKKQERILSRLLDASKSVRERDFEKKRKAETGTQITRRSPKEIDLNSLEGKNQLHEELLKALEQGYSKDYQELIRKYFEELEKSEKSVY